jgi:hypothetical protein
VSRSRRDALAKCRSVREIANAPPRGSTSPPRALVRAQERAAAREKKKRGGGHLANV